MNREHVRGWRVLCAVTGILALGSVIASALEPWRPEERARYLEDGSWPQRLETATLLGNHLVSPERSWNLHRLLLQGAGRSAAEIERLIGREPPPSWQGGLPAAGTPQTFVLLVDFPDYPHFSSQTVEDVGSKFFGDGDPAVFPYESLRNYYQRSSYGQLTIGGVAYGWYRAQYERAYYEGLGMGSGQETLMMEALDYFRSQGHGFAQYDNDHDGVIDAFFVKWTGPNNGWANFWWAYKWGWHSYPEYRISGKRLGKYVWSWISNPEGAPYQPRVDIHETGHLLGLPDLYDYYPSVGPPGGVGGMDMMHANWGDHNCFSKFMLGWLVPTFVSGASQTIALGPSGTNADAVFVMPTLTPGTLFGEFFMAQYRQRGAGNDPPNFPADGLVIWHVDATLDGSGWDFLYNNSNTSHKLVRLMEADGIEEIETGSGWVDGGDFYLPPQMFGPSTAPSSAGYASPYTGVQVDQLSQPGVTMSARVTATAYSWVDFLYVGGGDGSFEHPFNSVQAGVVAAPSRGVLMIRSGTTPETITISKPLTIGAWGGMVTIGKY